MPTINLRQCPFCPLTHVSVDGWRVCADRRAVLSPHGEEFRRVSAPLLDILTVFLARRGALVTTEQLRFALWGDCLVRDRTSGGPRSPDYSDAVIKQMVWRLKLYKIVHILTRSGRGWEIA